MKGRVSIVFLGLILIAGLVSAEEPYREGNTALSFAFNSAVLGDFNGGVGGKHWMSERWVVVGTVDFRYRQADSEENYNSKRTDYGAGLYLGLERHFGAARFSPYVGFGAGAGYTNNLTEWSSNEGDTTRERELADTRVSLRGAFGAEFWLTQRFSLAGEYRLEVAYTDGWREDRNGAIITDEPNRTDTTTWQAGIGSSALLLSIYF